MSQNSTRIIEIEEIHKEIDLIQGCINRMASNSFLLKGWLISLYAVVLALLPEKINLFIVMGILLVVTISFWYLDAFFLCTEKMYRKMYTWVLQERPKGNDKLLYDLNPHRFKNEVESIAKVMFSKTLGCFYGVPMLFIILLSIYSIAPIICKIVCRH
ncbi:MAG: hypothetical protein ACLTBU_06830 [Zhenhengia sp.]|uniref:hypothetical protein n=1 Tax=Zhenhengia sp. TaxID=2944208 RepID=UPI003994EB7D